MNLLIEGDNGTGKDTLAMGLQDQPFDIITYHKDVQQKIDLARTFKGLEQVLRFLNYNASCGHLMEKNARNGVNTITIRYWPSTLAAAYADHKLTESECDTLVDICIKAFSLPDLIVFLQCDHDERIERIEQRNSLNFDDKTLERGNRYAYYSDKIIGRLSDIVCRINTSGKSREEIQMEVLALVNKRRTYNGRAG